MKIRNLALIAVTGAAVVALPSAAQAAGCVVNVSANTTLGTDQPSCEYRVAPGVTLDLGGHLVGAVAFGTSPGTANATVRNGRIDPAGLSTPPVASIMGNGSSFTVNRVTVVRGNIAGTLTSTATSTITGNVLRAGKIALNGGRHTISANILTGGGVELTNAISGVINLNILHGNNGAGVGMTVTGSISITNNSITDHFIGVSARIGPNVALTVRSNAIVANLSTGVLIEHIVGTANIDSNLVAGNGFGVSPGNAGAGDGIYVNVDPGTAPPPVTVKDNTSIANAWIGIEAVAGVSDGGGNSAGQNQGPAQCVGVVCSAA